MKTTVLVLTLTATLSANAFAKGAKKPARRARTPVTVIDLAGPPDPESPFPAIVKKGHL